MEISIVIILVIGLIFFIRWLKLSENTMIKNTVTKNKTIKDLIAKHEEQIGVTFEDLCRVSRLMDKEKNSERKEAYVIKHKEHLARIKTLEDTIRTIKETYKLD